MNADDGIVWFLRATEQDLGAVIVVTLEGRISSATAQDLEKILTFRDRREPRGLIIDLSRVDYISGAGLRVLAAGATRLQAAGCDLVVCSLHPVVHTTFDMSGPIEHLTIESSLQAALQRLLPGADQP